MNCLNTVTTPDITEEDVSTQTQTEEGEENIEMIEKSHNAEEGEFFTLEELNLEGNSDAEDCDLDSFNNNLFGEFEEEFVLEKEKRINVQEEEDSANRNIKRKRLRKS